MMLQGTWKLQPVSGAEVGQPFLPHHRPDDIKLFDGKGTRQRDESGAAAAGT
jgi:hypothetical protein